MNTGKLLERGAELIDSRGHCKGTLTDYSGRLCAQGALLYAYHGSTTWPIGTPLPDLKRAATFITKRHPILADALRHLNASAGGQIIDWNNAAERTPSEVTATMRACAAIWRAKHEERQNAAVTESSAETVSA